MLPGASTFSFSRSSTDSESIDILDASTLVTSGPGGVIAQTSLDGGDPSTTGYALATSLPADSAKILSLTNPNRIATFCYKHGTGAVLYSTIPLAHYLSGATVRPAAAEQMKAYAANVVAYALAGACTTEE